jgi:hypothetical protein
MLRNGAGDGNDGRASPRGTIIAHDARENGRCVPYRMQRAIDAGEENTPTVVSKKPGTRNPKSIIAT